MPTVGFSTHRSTQRLFCKKASKVHFFVLACFCPKLHLSPVSKNSRATSWPFLTLFTKWWAERVVLVTWLAESASDHEVWGVSSLRNIIQCRDKITFCGLPGIMKFSNKHCLGTKSQLNGVLVSPYLKRLISQSYRSCQIGNICAMHPNHMALVLINVLSMNYTNVNISQRWEIIFSQWSNF